MHLARRALLAALLCAACRHPAPPATTAVIANTVDEPATDGPDPACVADCRANHGVDEGTPMAGYCDELCGPIDDANADCMAGCERSHEPAGHLDDTGEYVAGVDERSEDEIASDRRLCLVECVTVPTVSGEALEACTADCVASGDSEMHCGAKCDPDPYDECRYMPCD